MKGFVDRFKLHFKRDFIHSFKAMMIIQLILSIADGTLSHLLTIGSFIEVGLVLLMLILILALIATTVSSAILSLIDFDRGVNDED